MVTPRCAMLLYSSRRTSITTSIATWEERQYKPHCAPLTKPVAASVMKGIAGSAIAPGPSHTNADAAETWVCSYLSLALLAGVGLYQAFGWWWAEPVGALAMPPVILWQGWETEAHENDENGND